MLPQISKLEFRVTELKESPVVHKSFLWDFKMGDFVLRDGKLVEVEGLDYIKIWIEKAIRTEANTSFYTNYGSEHHSMIGTVFDRDYVQSELERMVKETLLKNEAITGVSNFDFELDGELLTMNFDVSTIYGNAGVTINAT
ncbi:Protein of unknown function [Anaerovirgula multivorans]|uniref:DUF2634 domain-containing protein n=1 Tax=Anaerovirgula multivorans TaxID=312168 RepID=A0A238ZT25_9FIRM|nr:DUF2634 domain-containing protein [Anaerovirgula multivorans]SNR86151.1 Protein of unknown function [Anaerovirgula multivorans]